VRAEAKQGANAYGAGLGAIFGRYSGMTGDNYNNNNAFANADLNPDTRVRIRLRADHVDAHDPRGSTTDPLTPTPNRYRQETLGGIFGYGAQGAQGRFELELGSMGKRYYNNADSGVQNNNRDDTTVGGTFYWRIAPKTSLLAQVKRTGIDFKNDVTALDSTEMRYLAGVTWEATAATTGIVKIGTLKKDFKDSTRADTSTPSLDAQIQWTPLTYSKWDFILSRAYRETTAVAGSTSMGDTVATTNSVVRWTHNWTSQFLTTATGTYGTDDYKGASAFGRYDKMPSFGVKGTYQMRRWLDFGADYTWSRRDSNITGADYKKNVIMLFVNATL
jgi:polysaccharide biosynthesis protein VpsM